MRTTRTRRNAKPRLPDEPGRAERALYERHGGTFARHYAKGRAEGRTAHDALRGARYGAKYSTFDWGHFDTDIDLPQSGGLVARVIIRHDEDGDTSFFGKFTDAWEPGAIAHSTEHVHNGGRDAYAYFIPGYAYNADEYRPEHGKHEAWTLAREYARRDYRRMLNYGNGWNMVGVTVTVFHMAAPAVELGRASLWGIESDSGRDFFEQTARELIPEAMQEARAERARLASILTEA